MKNLLTILLFITAFVATAADSIQRNFATTNVPASLTNVVKSLATNVVTQNASGASQTPWAGDIAAAFHSLTGAATLVSSNSIATNSANFGSNGVAPAGIVLNAEGAARVNGTLSVSNAVLIQGSSLTLPTGSITVPAGTVTANLFSGNGGSLTAIPESSVSGLITDLAAKFGTLVATTTGLSASGNGTSTATLSSPGFVWTNLLSVVARFASGLTGTNTTAANAGTWWFTNTPTGTLVYFGTNTPGNGKGTDIANGYIGGSNAVQVDILGTAKAFCIDSNANTYFAGTLNIGGSGGGNPNWVQTGSITAGTGFFGELDGTNFSYIMTTNAINTGVITCGKDTITNLTGNITLGGFANLTNNATCYASLTAIASGADRTVTMAANITTSDGLRVYTVTNGLNRVFSFKINQGIATNMSCNPFW